MLCTRFRTAGAIRTAAVTCLQALLQSNFLLETHVGKLLPNLQPKVGRNYIIFVLMFCHAYIANVMPG